ncbi:hypothetical protein HUG15_22165 [Salicibibacter cibarius]|uniref:Uncharacterized protein n=1 Tax=Salicibibacter cibarius TaxID=2743000 RepID=A0A7T6Z718_9BACI|nr:hypothetical protein [Salicibibacter cibarius]QQK78022.1 hypothetical protein HUG15_22165 [Salicibibacter cibarius]
MDEIGLLTAIVSLITATVGFVTAIVTAYLEKEKNPTPRQSEKDSKTPEDKGD